MKVQKYCVLLQKIFVFTILFFSCLAYTEAGPSQAVSCENVISNLNEFAQAVTQNAEFANSKEHTRLFQLYKTQFLGKEDIERTLEDVMDIAEEYPKLSKPALREQILTVEQRNYEPPQSLREVVQRLKNSAHQFQAQVFQPEANIGFWQRLLMPFKKEELTGLSKQEKKAKQKEHKAQFREYFDQILTPEDHEILKDDSINNIEKTVSVYRILDRIRNQMIEEGRDVQALSQAMVDLVHTSGFRNPRYITQLKSQNALDQIRGLEQILNERDIVAIRLNFEDHFSELINSLNVDHPIGSAKKENLSQILSDIQREIQNNSYTIARKQMFRVRALSLQESPFRGCLGGDCSTEGYFDLGLDPNFIYFTLTNKEFESSGHITVVLGTAHSKKEDSLIKTAFVDKIQNVPQTLILPMLEAVRLSLEELGYRLGLPVDVGDHNGLSNGDMTRGYIESEVNPLLTHQFKNFEPHKNKYNFNQGFSRAYLKPKLLEFEGWEANDFKVEAGEIYTGSKIPEELKAEGLFQENLSLKDSNKEEDQIQFINHLKLLTEIKELDLSEDFAKDYLNSKIKDRQVSFKVRKKALYTLISFGEVEKQDTLDWIINHFSENEQTALVGEISNWIDSNDITKQNFVLFFLHEFLREYLEKDIQFSFQSIIFNILSKGINIKIKVLLQVLQSNNVPPVDNKVIGYLIENIELQNLKKGVLILLFSHLTNEQQEWIDIEKFKELSSYKKIGILPYLSQRLFQQLTGEEVFNLYSVFTETHKNWVTFKQFQTLPYIAFHIKGEIPPYLASKLNQAEVQSLERLELWKLFPYLTSEQKNWITFRQFQTLTYYDTPLKEKIAPYLASRLSHKEVQSLEDEDLEILLPHLTTREQINWIDVEKRRIEYNLQQDFQSVY